MAMLMTMITAQPACLPLRVSVFFTTKAQEIDQRATEKTPG